MDSKSRSKNPKNQHKNKKYPNKPKNRKINIWVINWTNWKLSNGISYKTWIWSKIRKLEINIRIQIRVVKIWANLQNCSKYNG